jgi:hypothetical protein
MRFRDDARTRMLRRIGVLALILCTACLAIENAVLLSWAVTTRPAALFATAFAIFKVTAALAVPLLLVLLTGIAGWLVSAPKARCPRRGDGLAATEGRHE